MKFKCPVCGSVLGFDPDRLDQRIECPSCESSYSSEKIRKLLAARKDLATRKKQHRAKESSSNGTQQPEQAVGNESVEPRTAIDTSSDNLINRRRQQSTRRLAGLLVLILLIVGLAVGLTMVLQQPEAQTAKRHQSHLHSRIGPRQCTRHWQ